MRGRNNALSNFARDGGVNSSSSRWLAGIGVFVVVLIVASVLIALLGPGKSVEEYPAGTPEGVVQRYLQALETEDASLALSYLEAEAREGCTIQEVRQQTGYFAEGSHRRRVELLESKELSDGRQQITVRVTEVNVSPPFDVSEYSHEQTYTLVQEGDAWVLEHPAWPVNYCRSIEESERTNS